ncbi:phage head completion protein [Flagellimonas sp.]|uniref:phage head completion protein n=1 Tax=Flagellimonas sp. TaxID=2058762 RepID=UPI003F4A135B
MKLPTAGEMNAKVEFFENTESINSSGELTDTETTLGTRFVKRTDSNGAEEMDGRIVATGVRTFTMRFDATIALKASTLFVRDFDGDWYVFGPIKLLDSRKRYMELNCRKRGDS